jgi:glutamate-1-semialdehyde 2,1-aminomutase
VGAFGGRAEIMDQLSPDGPVYQAGTFIWESHRQWPPGLAQLRELERIDGWNLLEDLERNSKAAREMQSQCKDRHHFHRLGRCFVCSLRRPDCRSR